MSDTATKGRNSTPKEIDFTTYSLRYATNTWLTIEGLEKHWHESRVQADVASPQSIQLKTKNVSRLTLQFPIDQQLLSRTDSIDVAIDGTSLKANQSASGEPLTIRLDKSKNGWQIVNAFDTQELRKRPGLQGPIDDAFMDGFVFIGPDKAGSGSAVDRWVDEEFQHAKTEWRKHFRGDVQTIEVGQLTPEGLASKNLVLFGTPITNSLIAKVLAKLPKSVAWEPTGSLSIGSAKYPSDKHVPAMIYPNPLSPGNTVVINSGFTYREFAYLNNARQIAMLPDWAIIDVTTGRNFQYPGKIAAAGFFDERWQPQ